MRRVVLALALVSGHGCGPKVEADGFAEGTGAADGETTGVPTSSGSSSGEGEVGGVIDLPAVPVCGDGVPVAGQPCLEEAFVLPFDGLPTGAAAGDIDGDGIDELVVTDGAGTDAFVVVQLGADPVVLEPHPLPFANLPVAVGDVDGDGRADVVAASYDAQALLISHGPDLVQTSVDVPVEGPSVVGIVDGELGPALLVSSSGAMGAYVSLLVANGDGFDVVDAAELGMTDWGANDVREIVALPGAPSYAGASIEVMTCDFSQAFLLRLDVGFGSGAPSSSVTDLFSNMPTAIAAGDLDGDGVPDVVLSTPEGILRYGAANGVAELLATIEPAGASDVAVGDFDGDGLDDVAVGLDATGELWVGVGWTSGPAVTVALPATAYPHWLVVGDFDGDGFDDLAAVDYAGLIGVWLSRH